MKRSGAVKSVTTFRRMILESAPRVWTFDIVDHVVNLGLMSGPGLQKQSGVEGGSIPIDAVTGKDSRWPSSRFVSTPWVAHRCQYYGT